MLTSDLLSLIAQRRSIKQNLLKPDPLPREWIEQMLEAANWAPNHGDSEPWRFSVFAGAARQALGEAFAQSYRLGIPAEKYNPLAEKIQAERVWLAPVWIAVGMQPGGHHPEWEEVAAVGAAVHAAQLVAASLGLSAFWTSGLAVLHENTARFVGLQAPTKLLGFVYVGHPSIPWPRGVRRDWQSKVEWHWDVPSNTGF
ncbi:MAG: nitroreductase [Thermaceae bacterium]|nr:nitroreductase [Thermaceae bacterium]